MGDPRNVAHAKKVTQEKQHKAKAAQKTRAPRPAGKGQIEQTKSTAPEENAARQEAVKPPQPADSAQSEKSQAVLSKLKELEFHSRGNIEKLAAMKLPVRTKFVKREGDLFEG